MPHRIYIIKHFKPFSKALNVKETEEKTFYKMINAFVAEDVAHSLEYMHYNKEDDDTVIKTFLELM